MVASRINWFDKFLALLLSFLTLVLFVGISGANHTSHRDVDASLGILSRASNSKIGKSVKALFSPVKTEAIGSTIIAGDIPRRISEALEKALKIALTSLIKSFISAIMKLFDQLLSAIEGWVGTIDGLRDAIGAFRAAVSLKAYQVSECLIQSTESFISDIFGNDNSLAPTNNPQEKCNGIFGGNTGSREANVLSNEFSNIRQNSILAATEAENVTGFADFSEVPSQEEVQQRVENFAVDAAVLSGCGGGGGSSLDNDPILPVSSITLLKSECSDEIASNVTAANGVLARDLDNKEKVEDQVFSQAAPNCGDIGFIEGGAIDGLSSNTTAISAADNIQGISDDLSFSSDAQFSLTTIDGAIRVADSFDLGTLDKQECENADLGPTTLAATQSSADQGGNEFNFNQIITAFVEAITQFVNNLINKVFNLLTQTISKFLSQAPGGEYLSQAISNIANPISSALQDEVSNLSQDVINSL